MQSPVDRDHAIDIEARRDARRASRSRDRTAAGSRGRCATYRRSACPSRCSTRAARRTRSRRTWRPCRGTPRCHAAARAIDVLRRRSPAASRDAASGSGHSMTRWWEPPTCRVAAMAAASSTVAAERNASRRRAGVHGRANASSTAAAAKLRDQHEVECAALTSTSMPNTQLDHRRAAEGRRVEVPDLRPVAPRASAFPRRPATSSCAALRTSVTMPHSSSAPVMPAITGCHGRPSRSRSSAARPATRARPHRPARRSPTGN